MCVCVSSTKRLRWNRKAACVLLLKPKGCVCVLCCAVLVSYLLRVVCSTIVFCVCGRDVAKLAQLECESAPAPIGMRLKRACAGEKPEPSIHPRVGPTLPS